jgi:hypothetical protein
MSLRSRHRNKHAAPTKLSQALSFSVLTSSCPAAGLLYHLQPTHAHSLEAYFADQGRLCCLFGLSRSMCAGDVLNLAHVVRKA